MTVVDKGTSTAAGQIRTQTNPTIEPGTRTSISGMLISSPGIGLSCESAGPLMQISLSLGSLAQVSQQCKPCLCRANSSEKSAGR